MFIFSSSLAVTEEALNGTDWITLGVGLVGALATVVAVVIADRLQRVGRDGRKFGKIEGNALEFQNISEKNSFCALDVLKVLDLRGSPSLRAGVEGMVVLSDSHLIIREGDAGNGLVFCYATSGSIVGASEGYPYEWGEIKPHSPLKQNISAKCFALGVNLDNLSPGRVARITNQVVYRGAFDNAATESFETHIDRNTLSLTFLLLFSPCYPCLSVQGEIDVGRDQWGRVEKNRPAILNGGTVLYWRVFPDEHNDSLRHLSKYRLQWTWHPSGHSEPVETASVESADS